MEKQRERDRELRKQRHMLTTLGMGVILFGAWNVIKSVLTLVLTPESLVAREEIPPDERHIFWIVLIVLLTVVLLIELSLRLFIGLNAIRRGQGIEKARPFLVPCVILIVTGLLGVILEVQGFLAEWAGSESLSSFLTSVLIDFTSLGMLVDLVLTARREKRLSKA